MDFDDSCSFRVYPRVCGGTRLPGNPFCVFVGLSPRVRGNHLVCPLLLKHERSIPACAGEPRRPRKAGCSGKVYPRVCGGTGYKSQPVARGDGLSPRVRGNPGRSLSGSGRTGSIPACAGEPCRSGRFRPMIAVYPRVCGGTGDVIPNESIP